MMATTLPDATVPGEGLRTWESQVRQYPKVGKPGLSYERREVAAAQVTHNRTGTVVAEIVVTVDCLLYRNRKGALIGILNHYRDEAWDFDGTKLEEPGNFNVWVHPRRRRRGIGTLLVSEALRRWSDIDLTHQRYTEGGRALAASLLDRDGAT